MKVHWHLTSIALTLCWSLAHEDIKCIGNYDWSSSNKHLSKLGLNKEAPDCEGRTAQGGGSMISWKLAMPVEDSQFGIPSKFCQVNLRTNVAAKGLNVSISCWFPSIPYILRLSFQATYIQECMCQKGVDIGSWSIPEKDVDKSSWSRCCLWAAQMLLFFPTWRSDPIWLIFCRWVETTNQLDCLPPWWKRLCFFWTSVASPFRWVQKNLRDFSWNFQGKFQLAHQCFFKSFRCRQSVQEAEGVKIWRKSTAMFSVWLALFDL